MEKEKKKEILYIVFINLCFRYVEENLKVGRKKTNVMFIGDGKGKTIIAGGKSVADHLTTFHTASFGKNILFFFNYHDLSHIMSQVI